MIGVDAGTNESLLGAFASFQHVFFGKLNHPLVKISLGLCRSCDSNGIRERGIASVACRTIIVGGGGEVFDLLMPFPNTHVCVLFVDEHQYST